MKYLALISLLMLIACDPTPKDARENIVDNTPLAIGQIDGVTLWKLKDGTPGGAKFVYFTTPCCSTYSEQNCGKNCTQKDLVK